MNSLLLARAFGIVEMLNFTGEPAPKVVKVVGRRGDGHRFLGFIRCNQHRLLENSITVTGLHYDEILGRFEAELQKNGPIS